MTADILKEEFVVDDKRFILETASNSDGVVMCVKDAETNDVFAKMVYIITSDMIDEYTKEFQVDLIPELKSIIMKETIGYLGLERKHEILSWFSQKEAQIQASKQVISSNLPHGRGIKVCKT